MATTREIGRAIHAINPNAQYSGTGTDLDGIVWKTGTTPISKTDIQAKIDALAYIEKREAEYPSISQQLDLQYWDQVNGTTKWKEAIAKVKSDNPKP